MDITKPIPHGKLVRVEGKLSWIEFKYEKLHLFYFHCGLIQHVGRVCVMGKTGLRK